MNATDLIADKKNTRAVLAEMALDQENENLESSKAFTSAARKLAEAIGDKISLGYDIGGIRLKTYSFDQAIDRAIELITEARKVPGLEAGIDDLNGQMENMRRMLDTTIEERTRAQEAVALVGATFNDYREAAKVDTSVDIHEHMESHRFARLRGLE